MLSNLKIAICQLMVTDDLCDNLNRAGDMIATASRNGAGMVVLPEMFSVPYNIEVMAQEAEFHPGPTTRHLSDLAKTNRVVLIGGSIPEKTADGKVFNTSFTFDQQGTIIGCYRKIHLFDIDLLGKISFQESTVFSPGQNLQIIRHNGLEWAVIICYDIRFPELARLAALAGAKLLIVPAAFNTTTGPAHWELLMRCRAVDNQIFVAAASPALNPAAAYHAWGHSLVADPWGNVIVQAGNSEEIIYADLDLSLLERVRHELPLLKHRRTDLYSVKDLKLSDLNNN